MRVLENESLHFRNGLNKQKKKKNTVAVTEGNFKKEEQQYIHH